MTSLFGVTSTKADTSQLVRFEDREDAEETLHSVLDDESDTSWMMLRYSLLKGGGGAASSTRHHRPSTPQP